MTATAGAKTLEITIDSNRVYTEDNGVIVSSELPAAAYIENDITLVPLRFINESLGADVQWDEAQRKVTVTNGTVSAELFIGSDKANVTKDGAVSEVTLAAPAVIVNDITLVPLRFVSENCFDADVQYVDDMRQVVICDEEPSFEIGGDRADRSLIKAFYYLNSSSLQSYSPDAYYNMAVGGFLSYLSAYYSLDEALRNVPLSSEAQQFLSSFTTDDLIGEGNLKSSYARVLKVMGAVKAERARLMSNLTDEQISDYYSDNYLCAKHILLLTSDESGTPLADDEKAAVLDKAEEILDKIRAGDDFDALMEENTEDPGSAHYPDGYVFTAGEMVPEFENAVRALSENEVSEPVESSYGYHIIKRLPLPELTDEEREMIAGIIADSQLDAIAADTRQRMVSDPMELYYYVVPEQLRSYIQ